MSLDQLGLEISDLITWVIFIAPAVTIGWKLFSFLNRYEARIIKLEHDSADNKKRDEE